MITHTARELLALQLTDVTIPRTVRKSLFGFRLWHQRKQRVQHHKGVSSRDVLPRIDTANHGQSREHTAAPPSAVVTHFQRFSAVCMYAHYWTSTSKCVVTGRSCDAGETWGMPWRWAVP